jgi:hypothetical protein
VNGFVSAGTISSGNLPMAGDGIRLLWYPRKGAFRAGYALDDSWDDANIGNLSVALGTGTRASGFAGTALGAGTSATGDRSFAAGAYSTASASFSTALGYSTTASGQYGVAIGRESVADGVVGVALGQGTFAGDYGTATGHSSVASGSVSTAMGALTVASGSYSTATGYATTADAAYSFTLGAYASSGARSGSFVFGDASTLATHALVTATADNQFVARASGGAIFYSDSALTTGVTLAAGGGAWSNLSDARMKSHFRDLDGEDVLSKLARIPIREWSYVSQGERIRHVGPTAQDFRAAFGLGENEVTINTLDPDGIGLRAIQALDARTHALARENATLARENAALREEFAALRALVEAAAALRPR